MTVVIASHNLRELEELCDRICLIHKGKLLLEREIDEIKLGLRKVQVAFTEVPDNSFFEEINAVSYTHLDVYKRQEYTGSVKGIPSLSDERYFMTITSCFCDNSIYHKICALTCGWIISAPTTQTEKWQK